MTNVSENGNEGMLKALQRYFSGVSPVYLNGSIAVCIAVLTALNMSFATDESAKYINPELRFWLLISIGSIIQGLHALSKFRDDSYGKHVEVKRLEAEEFKREHKRP